MPFAAAAAAATVVGAGATIYSASQSGKAADKANQTQQRAQDQMQANLAPYMEAGTNALGPQQALLGLQGPEAAKTAMDNFQSSPGYEYQVQQGMRGVNARAASQGMLNSGATLKALQDRGNSLAAQDFGTYYNRLAGLAGLGQNAAAGVGNSGVQTAAGQAQTDVSAASTQANMYGQAAQGIGNAINNYGNNSMYAQKTNALYNAPGGGYFGTTGGSPYGAGGYTGQGPFF